MPITPLPQFEADLAEHLAEQEDRDIYERLRAPTTVVIRHGLMGLVSELPYNGEAKPGCGSKLVARTTRGVELGEMLTSTCPNSGCSKSVSRKEMLDYIDRSGGRDYPFSDKGQILRIATKEDLDAQAAIEADRFRLRGEVARIALEARFPAKIVEVERILGDERMTVYVASEQRIESQQLSNDLEKFYRTRVFIRPVGARDEARLTADYERCGQHCCCKNFLKVLKPISMRSAKQQKATLEPLKISGRCGRLMCCLRYEDSTYQDLKSNLPNRKTRVGTPEGDGIVIDSQILTQLVLIELDSGTRVAIPVEELTAPESKVAPPREERTMPGPVVRGRPAMPSRDARGPRSASPSAESSSPTATSASRRIDRTEPPARPDEPQGRRQQRDEAPTEQDGGAGSGTAGEATRKKRRRKRRKKPSDGGEMTGSNSASIGSDASDMDQAGFDQSDAEPDRGPIDEASESSPSGPRKKRRRRRKRKPGGEQGSAGQDSGGQASGDQDSGDTPDSGSDTPPSGSNE